MTPIISPWIIYWLSLCDGAKALLIFGAVCGLVWYVWLCLDERSVNKWVVTILSLALILGLLVPSKATALQMLVAQNVTYERVDVVEETIVDIYNDIVLAVGDGGDG